MKSTTREYAVDTVDVLVVYGSYKQSKTAGKFDMRAHIREALVSRQDSTGSGVARFRGAVGGLFSGRTFGCDTI
jgi:hypothetical protein